MDSRISKFLNKKIVIFSETGSVFQAARAMCEKSVGAVVVMSRAGYVLGVITDRDLTCDILAFRRSPDAKLGELTSGQVVCADVEDSLERIVMLMKRNGVRRIPIVKTADGGKQECVGMVTVDDLIVNGLIGLRDLQQILNPQVHSLTAEKMPSERRQRRRESRRQQSLNFFLDTLAREMEVDKDEAETIGTFLLECLVERISYTEASDLISCLPLLLQEDLFDVQAGPNRKITAKSIMEELKSFDIPPDKAHKAVRGFWRGLELYVLSNETDQVLGQLPADIQILFTGQPYHTLPGSLFKNSRTHLSH